jgi:hypothetical protein
MDSVNCASKASVMWNSALMEESAGEIMLDEMGDTSVKQDTISVAAHFRLMDQFFGFAGSSTESHVIRLGSRALRFDFCFSRRGVAASTSCSYGMPP